MSTMRRLLFLLFLSGLGATALPASAATLTHGWQNVDGIHLFYREGGDPKAPTILFLPGNPLSSIQYVKVMEDLVATQAVHVVSIDYPSFGYSDAPDRKTYAYTFDHVAATVHDFLKARGITQYGLFMQDYGIPIGFRLISVEPQAITVLVVQNGVIHLDGFPTAQDPRGELRQHWLHRNAAVDARRASYAKSLGYPRAVGWSNDEDISPDVVLQATTAEQRPGVIEARNDLWFDYGNNVARYPAWQAQLRKLKIPVLVLWGSHDDFFTIPGAFAYLRDAPQAEIHVLDAGHFATLQVPDEIARLVSDFLARHRVTPPPTGLSAP
jgi:pimeloyl-ACP methyl ester carboxylesterase